MDFIWPVVVVDDGGAAVAGARVCLAEASALGAEHFPYPSLAATHDHKGGGRYEPKAPIAPKAGKWVLLVSHAGKAPVVQPLTIAVAKAKGDFTTSARVGAVVTVTITSAVRTVGPSKTRETRFNVKLYPAAEMVFLGGTDYDKRDISTGWLFHLYGFHRAEALRREKKIHPGTIVTVFSTATITRTTRVWGTKKWVDVEVAKLGNPATRVLPPLHTPYQPVAGIDLHPTDFYKYLDEVGKRAPGSVIEVGIFSHSYPGGPILYNTGETAVFRARADRDPADFDARGKDFNATNLALYSDMPASFAAACRFTVWGCSATTRFKNRSIKALEAIRKGLTADEFFLVEVEYRDHANTVTSTEEERTSELRHRWEMDSVFRSRTYAAEAASAFSIEVRSACPGCGSDPRTVEGLEMLMVDLAVYKPVFDYFHLKFSPEFLETNGKWDKGYVDYHKLRSRPVVPKPGFDAAYYLLTVQRAATRWAAAGASLRFWNGKFINHSTNNVSLTSRVVADLVTAGKTGFLYVLRDRDDTKSQAVYAQEDGRIFAITRDAAARWTVRGAEL